ncbi:MAG: hypothetical protein AAFR93_15440 [Pseudomonadota bacterium]
MLLRVIPLAVCAITLTACEEAMTEAATDTAPQTAQAQAEAAAAGPAAAAQDLSPPPGLTGEELVIWGALNDTAKADAKAFIADGGTFAEFYGG